VLGFSTWKLDDEVLKNFSGLALLRSLDLQGQAITDHGVSALTGLRSFQWLSLSTTDITDKSLPDLAKLGNLRHLNLEGTYITEKGLQFLQKRLPETRIQWNPFRREGHRTRMIKDGRYQ
jgi:Leucine-rich repeat (LRR) protein